VRLQCLLWAIVATAVVVVLALVLVTSARAEEPTVAYALEVRLTYYTLSGLTYSGYMTRPGTAACSWNLELGTRLRLPDGEEFVCQDRGLLGARGWVDLWREPALAHKYGDYVVVEVLE
jgi:hypothetical protein